MELKYRVVDRAEIDPWVLDGFNIMNEPFCFWFNRGTLYINKDLGHREKVLEAIGMLWEHEVIDDETEERFDRAYKALVAVIGEAAAYQAWQEWMRAAKASREAKARERAGRFLSDVWEKTSVDSLEQMHGYDYGFLNAIFFEVSARQRTDKRYKDCYQVERDAIFLYAYQCGVEAGRKAVMV